MRKKKCVLGGVSLVLLVLLALRLVLPSIVLREVNRKLSKLEGYRGHVDKIGLSLWRGACRIEGLKIARRSSASS